jgi:hypothetical protein
MRVCFLVDGFNVYHSLVDAWAALASGLPKSTKWLDLRALLSNFLPEMSSDAEVAAIHYFSALAHHRVGRQPDTIQCHHAYMSCLKDTGVQVHLRRRFRRLIDWADRSGKPEVKRLLALGWLALEIG